MGVRIPPLADHPLNLLEPFESMKHSVRETGAWQRTLDVEIPAETVDVELDAIARAIQKRAVLPGFRRGKVPLDAVRQNFAESIEHEFFDHFLPRARKDRERRTLLIARQTVRLVGTQLSGTLEHASLADDRGECTCEPIVGARRAASDG